MDAGGERQQKEERAERCNTTYEANNRKRIQEITNLVFTIDDFFFFFFFLPFLIYKKDEIEIYYLLIYFTQNTKNQQKSLKIAGECPVALVSNF